VMRTVRLQCGLQSYRSFVIGLLGSRSAELYYETPSPPRASFGLMCGAAWASYSVR